MDLLPGLGSGPDAVRFGRPKSSRRNKPYRRRGADDDDDGGDDEGGQAASKGDDSAEPHTQPAQPAVRARGARRPRFRGVAFTASDASTGHHNPNQALILAGQDEEAPDAKGIAGRFTPQTGLIGDVHDRHMTEYIESRLASRRHATGPGLGMPGDGSSAVDDGADTTSRATARFGDQPTKHGKLFEVAVPADDASAQQAARLRRADDASKPRYGRNRRGSDDMERDQLVDQFLHENRLNVYDVPGSHHHNNHHHNHHHNNHSSSRSALGHDMTADERMAEQFRRQYLEEMARRRQRRRRAQPQRKPAPTGDVLRGPKLGGSRNSRAAVRNILLQQEKEKAAKRV